MGVRCRIAVLLAFALGLAACSSGGSGAKSATSASTQGANGYSAQTASFDLAVNSPQAFLIGLIGPAQESVAYGSVEISFSFSGPAKQPLPTPRAGPTATARFVPVPGQSFDPSTAGPQLVAPSVARGVYRTDPMTFDAAGYWEATARFTVGGRKVAASSAFEVLATHQVPFVGEPAPRTVQALAGDAGVPAVAIDSRAQDGAAIPDPELHSVTIASALDAKRPLMVVVSTPTYCTSRFCGPITESVAKLAAKYRDRMDFVHLEIWADFTNQRLNPWVKDWIVPRDGGDGREPWVFVIDRSGIITHRFDNLASDADLEGAAQDVMR